MTLQELYQSSRKKLRAHDIESPDLDARILISYAANLSQEEFITKGELEVDDAVSQKLSALLERRCAGEPISRIKGSREFWSLEFSINEHTLDPRPDSEILVEAAKEFVDQYDSGSDSFSEIRVLDLGTGSGCLLIALASSCPHISGLGIDRNPGAVHMAQKNAEKHSVENRCVFQDGNWGEGIDESFDVILSNPPYIKESTISNLAREVRDHDPILALDGGEDGLCAIQKILFEIKRLLKPSGRAFVEIGHDQCEQVVRLIAEAGLCQIAQHADLSGMPRVVEISNGDK